MIHYEFNLTYEKIKIQFNDLIINKKVCFKEDFEHRDETKPECTERILSFLEKYPYFVVSGRLETLNNKTDLWIWGIEAKNKKGKKYITEQAKIDFTKLMDPYNYFKGKNVKIEGLRISSGRLSAYPT